jgi:uncharacterized integral membrane protein
MIYLIIMLVLASLAIIVSLQNAALVTITFLAYKFEGSLALALIIALLAGFVISLVVTIPAILKRDRTIARQKKLLPETDRSAAQDANKGL